VYGYLGQYFSPADLNTFQKAFGLPQQAVESSIGDHSNSTMCVTSPNSCNEANLDIQYIMAVGSYVPTTYFYDNSTDFVVNWLTEIASMENPPLVNSISYGADEGTIPASYKASFDSAILSLVSMGGTVLVGSGDDGVGGLPVYESGNRSCGYNPVWPATAPYVLSVGATQGPESGMPEVTCSYLTNGTITSGGGFSNMYAMPEWQKAAVDTYFDTVQGTTLEPFEGYNRSGRGYPDVSLMGSRYEVFIGGSVYYISGTVIRQTFFLGCSFIANYVCSLLRRRPLLE
jgi:tripeptidyl-peptidase-1